mmetsp:Transcript_126214/g.353470  ORF Transcript_126214/g.353470 Transcript_126214/m.353470 type:complete len:296 (-) Transcript_126214:302-1189(-)
MECVAGGGDGGHASNSECEQRTVDGDGERCALGIRGALAQHGLPLPSHGWGGISAARGESDAEPRQDSEGKSCSSAPPAPSGSSVLPADVLYRLMTACQELGQKVCSDEEGVLMLPSHWDSYQVWPATVTGPFNEGSIGHPHLCSKPCIFAVSGTCEGGNACSFCHLPHDKIRPCHLDKQQRAHLEGMDSVEQAILLLSLLGSKLQLVDASPKTQRLFSDLAFACGVTDQVHLERGHQRGSRMLMKSLRRMTVRQLLFTLAKRVAERQASVGEAAEALLSHCRAVARGMPAPVSL